MLSIRVKHAAAHGCLLLSFIQAGQERKDLDYNIKVEYNENSENEESVNGTMSTHKLTEPVEAYLDVSKSTTYTHGLFGLTADSIHTVKPTEADLKATGLDNPQCTVTMVVEDGTEYKLLLGDSYEETSGEAHI